MQGIRTPLIAAVAVMVALCASAYAAVEGTGPAAAMKKPLTKAAVKKLIAKYVSANPDQLAGPQGPQGPAGQPGKNGTDGTDGIDGASFHEPVPDGVTIRGVWDVTGDPSAAGVELTDYIQFPTPIPDPLVDGPANTPPANKGIGVKNVDGNPTIGPVITNDNEDPLCDGTFLNPTAPPGRLCIYVRTWDNIVNDSLTVFAPMLGGGAQPVNHLGFIMSARSFAAGHARIEGSWAYTAPT